MESPDPRLAEALRLAVKLHAGQWREGDAPLPYACHVAEVVFNLRWVGGVTDPEVLCAGFLHDTLEDTGYTVKKIAKRFGPRVADLVRQVTRDEPPPGEVEGLSSDERFSIRTGYLIREILAMDADAQTIKLADRLSNLREAMLTKDQTVHRYAWQSGKMLAAISPSANSNLYKALQGLTAKVKIPPTSTWHSRELTVDGRTFH